MEGMIGEIRLFAGNFAPRSWALCEGQLIPISQNTALFSILGTTYGGDGRTTFGLPDLRGRVAIHAGHGPGLSDYDLGQKSGSETNTLTLAQMPVHNHAATVSVELPASAEEGDSESPVDNVPAVAEEGAPYATSPDGSTMAPASGTATIGNTGGGQPVNNMQPYNAFNYIIALQGVFPSRS